MELSSICYFGSHKYDYSRNEIIKKGLSLNGFKIVDCRSRHNVLIRNFVLFFKFLRIRKEVDVILVSEMSHASMPIAYLVSRLFDKLLIFDPLISAYDTIVEDRKLIKKGGLLSRVVFFLDKLCLKTADFILADTEIHRKYFSETFEIPMDKIGKVIVGADTKYYYPEKKEVAKVKDEFNVLFQGTFIPLHGIKYIIEAADLLRDRTNIRFTIIGEGQEKQEILKISNKLNLTNVSFLPLMSQGLLREKINQSDICLGIFGETVKAKRVIPNKVYQYLACGKPIITGRSEAILELLEHEKNSILCDFANAKSIAESIVRLMDDNELRKKIAYEGLTLFQKECVPLVIGSQLEEYISRF